MKCPECRTNNRAGARFCRQCNVALAIACEGCGKVSLFGSHFCDACGLRLPAAEDVKRGLAEPAPRTSAKRGPKSGPKATPPAAQRVLQGENKQVTVLFCDIVNSTPLTERLGPEATHALLDRFFALVMREVNHFEGTVNQFLGDGFMALFGVPVAHEDHARRAVLSAMAIRQRLASGIDMGSAGKVDLVVRMGINTGFVVVGQIGDNLRMEYTANGDTTVVAARLQQVATPGDILISGLARNAAGDIAEFEPVGGIQLKGKSHLVDAFKVLGSRRYSDSRVSEGRPLSPFVGRDRELASLEDALAEAEGGEGRIVGLVGEPGIGKTRLLGEFKRAVDGPRATYLEGHCAPYGTTAAYSLVLDLLRSACRIPEQASEQQIAGRVAATLTQVGLDAQADAAPLIQLMGVAAETDQGSPTGAAAFKARLFDVLTQMVLRASRLRPLILALENLHWVDPASAEFLAVLAERLAGAPMVVIATYRPGYTPPWSGKSYASQIALRPLSAAQAMVLIHPIMHDGQERLTASLVAKAGGNPFYLEELARNAVEHHDLSESTVPNSVHGVIASRIDRLGGTAKRVLQAASVLGRKFAADTLAAMLGQATPLGDALAELVHSEFLLERVTLSGVAYEFRHALTQDVAYGTLLQAQRARYHAAAGTAILRANSERPATVAELLAHHFRLSDRDDDAVAYGLLAAETAQRRWANEIALDYYKSVAHRLETMPDTPANRGLRIDTVIGQAEVMFALGRQLEHVQALEAIRPLVEECGDHARRAAWNYWTGFLHSFTGSPPDVSIGYCREAARIASEAGLIELQAYANCCLAHVSVLAGSLDDAMAAGARALPVFENARNIHWACRTLWGMSMAANAIGDWSSGLDICKRALDHGRKAEDNRLIVVGWMRTGSTLIFQGQPGEGIACCDTALSLAPSPYDARMIRSIRAYGRLRAGEGVDLAVEELSEATAWFQQSKLQYTWTYFSLWLTEGHLRLGQADQAAELAGRALSAAETYGYRHLEGLAHRIIAESMLHADLSRARRHAEQAIQLLKSVGARNDLAKARVVQASLAPTEAPAQLAEALREFRALGTVDEIARTESMLR
jgi:class 3 adenylate cyclase/tetratricopeptide (TPR) repeat protein